MRLFASILLLTWPAAAAVITGTVSDIDGQLVVGATVRLDGGSETKTGEDGAAGSDSASGAGALDGCNPDIACVSLVTATVVEEVEPRPPLPPPRLSAVMVSPSVRSVERPTSKVVSQLWPLIVPQGLRISSIPMAPS